MTKRTTSGRNETQNAMSEKDWRISELDEQLAQAERGVHELAEKARYALEAAAVAVREKNESDADDLAALAHSLPYLMTGRHEWPPEAQPSTSAPNAWAHAEAIARKHGYSLPGDPRDAVKCLLELASMLLFPAWTMHTPSLRHKYPLDRPSR